MPYLVDGNNLAHVLGLANGGLADRESCARTVGLFCRSRGAKAIIVFDGAGPGPAGAGAPAGSPRTRVVFSEGRSADEVILKMLDAGAPKTFIVVTSDKSLGDKARHRGAAVERAHEFARRLDRKVPGVAGARSGATEKPLARETPEEVEAWLAVFDPDRLR